MFDCIGNQREKLIKNPQNLLAEFNEMQGSFNLNTFLKTVSEPYRQSIGRMFDIIASARSRNIDEVANNFAEALLFKN